MRPRTAAHPESPPARDGAWDYGVRHAAGAQHSRFLRQRRGGGRRATLLLDIEARGLGYLAV